MHRFSLGIIVIAAILIIRVGLLFSRKSNSRMPPALLAKGVINFFRKEKQ